MADSFLLSDPGHGDYHSVKLICAMATWSNPASLTPITYQSAKNKAQNPHNPVSIKQNKFQVQILFDTTMSIEDSLNGLANALRNSNLHYSAQETPYYFYIIVCGHLLSSTLNFLFHFTTFCFKFLVIFSYFTFLLSL